MPRQKKKSGTMSNSVISRHHARKQRHFPSSFNTYFPNRNREQTNSPLDFLSLLFLSCVLRSLYGEEMVDLLSGKMKRKGVEELSGFPLSSPARKIRRLVRKFYLFFLLCRFLLIIFCSFFSKKLVIIAKLLIRCDRLTLLRG